MMDDFDETIKKVPHVGTESVADRHAITVDDDDERERQAHEQREQERGPGETPRQVLAQGYIYAVSPENGEPVVFVPGQELPDWAVEVLDAGRFVAGSPYRREDRRSARDSGEITLLTQKR